MTHDDKLEREVAAAVCCAAGCENEDCALNWPDLLETYEEKARAAIAIVKASAEAENARLRKALEEMLDANAELAEFVGLSDMSGDNFANACAQMGRAVDAARAALSAPDAGASKDEPPSVLALLS